MRILPVVIGFLLVYAIHCDAQQNPALPDAPQSAVSQKNFQLDTDVPYFATVFAGGGVHSAMGVQGNSSQFGFEAGAEDFGKTVGGIELLELGAMGPLQGRSSPVAFWGFDMGPMLWPKPHDIFFAPVGYSYVFSEGNALNYGLGWNHHYKTYRAISVEVRDYYIFTQTHQHNVAIRIGWQFLMHDP